MDFTLSDEQKMLIQTLRSMGERENFRELAQTIDANAEFPYRLMPAFAELGLLGMTLSEAYGGGGQPGINAILAIEELAKFSPMIAAPVFESNVGPVRVIDIFGSEDHKRSIIPGVCRGERSVSVCMTEPEAAMPATTWSIPVSARPEATRALEGCWWKRACPASASAGRRSSWGSGACRRAT